MCLGCLDIRLNIQFIDSICGFQGTYLMYVRSTKLDNTSLSSTNGLALNSSVALRLVLIKLLSANGDGEIRTLDPLLARQVLSQLSYAPIWYLYLIRSFDQWA